MTTNNSQYDLAKYDSLSAIISYEEGELSDEETLTLFAHLIKTGMAWTLQGHYGRTAQRFIDAGLISPEGEIDWDEVEYRLHG